MTRRVEWVLIFTAIAIKLWLTAARTLVVLGWAHYDDRWFLEKAMSILKGDWLGPYNYLTLIKGAGYPLWIALVSTLGIPLLLAQQLLYALASLAVCQALAPSLRSPLSRLGLFVVLLFNPMTFSDEIATRVLRESFYPALGLLVFAGVAGVVLRLDAPRGVFVSWSLLAGVAIAWFWHVREESIWITPLLGFAFLAVARRRRGWIAAGTVILIFFIAQGAIVLTNGLRYGTFVDVEFKERSFLRAYGSLARVRQHPPVPRVPVSREARQRVYAVSPAFAELRPYLEDSEWTRGASDLIGERFMWAFREAVHRVGYYARGARAVGQYYDRLADEIDAARSAGRLDARPARASLAPPLLHGQRRAVFETWIRRSLRLPFFPEFSITPRHSDGTLADLRMFSDITRSPLAPRRNMPQRIQLLGWVIHVDGPIDLAIQHSDGTPVRGARVSRLPSPDLYEHLKQTWKEFPPARHARFDIEAPLPDTFMVLSLRGREVQRIELDPFSPEKPLDPKIRMSIDRVTSEQIGAVESLRLRILMGLGRLYQIAFPPFVVAAVLLYVFNLRHADWTMALLIAGLLAAVAARMFILALIDVTSFFVFNGEYQAPAHPLLLTAAMLMAMRKARA